MNDGKDTPACVPIHLERPVNHLVTDYEKQAISKGLEIKTAFTGTEMTVQGDLDRIEQIAGNLLSNALKFTDGGEITLNISCGVGQLVLEDTGAGIEKARLQRIFRLFERSQAENNVCGHGLGLPIVQGLVHLLGETIDVAGTEGIWSRFRVVLSLEEMMEAPMAEADSAVRRNRRLGYLSLTMTCCNWRLSGICWSGMGLPALDSVRRTNCLTNRNG